MKAGWQVKSLGEVCEVQNGGTPKSNVAEYWANEVAWLTPKDMGKLKTPYVSDTLRRISKAGLSKCSAKLVPAASVIMSTRAPIGHLAMNTVPMAFNQGCRGLIPKTELEQKYLYYYLMLNVEPLKELGTGTTFKELAAGVLKAFTIPIPPLEEQKRIVAVLDAALEGLTRAKENAETNLKNARELYRGTLSALTVITASNEECRLSEMVKENSPITYGVVKPGPEGSVPFVRGGDLRDGKITIENLRTITQATSSEYERTRLLGGELLICLVGQPGQTGIVPPDLKDANIARQTALVRLRPEFHNEYVSFFLLSDEGQRRLGDYTQGSIQQVINLRDLKELLIPVPNFETQKIIAAQCKALRLKVNALTADN